MQPKEVATNLEELLHTLGLDWQHICPWDHLDPSAVTARQLGGGRLIGGFIRDMQTMPAFEGTLLLINASQAGESAVTSKKQSLMGLGKQHLKAPCCWLTHHKQGKVR
jgi:hypothetical protein